MDEFEKAGLALPEETKTRIRNAIQLYNMKLQEVIDMVAGMERTMTAAALTASTLQVHVSDVIAMARSVRGLPRTSSKGYWRDVMPRRKR